MRLPLGLWKSLKILHNGNFVINFKFKVSDLDVSKGQLDGKRACGSKSPTLLVMSHAFRANFDF